MVSQRVFLEFSLFQLFFLLITFHHSKNLFFSLLSHGFEWFGVKGTLKNRIESFLQLQSLSLNPLKQPNVCQRPARFFLMAENHIVDNGTRHSQKSGNLLSNIRYTFAIRSLCLKPARNSTVFPFLSTIFIVWSSDLKTSLVPYWKVLQHKAYSNPYCIRTYTMNLAFIQTGQLHPNLPLHLFAWVKSRVRNEKLLSTIRNGQYLTPITLWRQISRTACF